jgi:F-type H+-transporting ATPase subunit delta
VARRYGSALADVAIERGEAREVQTEIEYWASLVEATPLLREVFANPTIAYDQKQMVLEELILRSRVRVTTASFLRVLLRNQRLAQLKDVAERFAHMSQQLDPFPKNCVRPCTRRL